MTLSLHHHRHHRRVTRAARLLVLTTVIALMSACANQVVVVNKQFARDVPSIEEVQHFFFWGWGAVEKNNNPVTVCGATQNIVRIERSYQPTDALFTLLTLGIYMPQTVRIYCRK